MEFKPLNMDGYESRLMQSGTLVWFMGMTTTTSM